MRIDWSKVPRGTPVKEIGNDKPYLFVRYEGGSVVVRDVKGKTFFLPPEEANLYSLPDFAKYNVLPDIKETARRIVDRAADALDEDEAGERLTDEMFGILHSIQDLARAFMEGKTILYRPHFETVEWRAVEEGHVPDMEAYVYKVQGTREHKMFDVVGADDEYYNAVKKRLSVAKAANEQIAINVDWRKIPTGTPVLLTIRRVNVEPFATRASFIGIDGSGKLIVSNMNGTHLVRTNEVLLITESDDEGKATTADNHRGFYRKYHIAKADGSPTDPKADYFVLRLDEDNPWGHACREAVLGLARNLRDEFPQLASDLITRYGEKSADAMVIKGSVRDAHFDGLEVSIARERIKAGECDKEVLERYEKIWMGDEKVTPLNLCIAEQVIQKGFCDGVVVPRFLRLMNEGRIETRSPLEIDAPWVTLDIGYYGVRPAIRIKDQNADPTPRYRPYDPAKDSICLPKFCEAQIHTESDGELAVIEAVNTHGVVARFYDGDGNHRTTAHITWEALAQWWRGEDNEPFGVKL